MANSTNEIYRILEKRDMAAGKKQITNKGTANTEIITVSQDQVTVLQSAWSQQSKWHTNVKTIITGQASQELDLELIFVLDGTADAISYKQHMQPGYKTLSVNKLFKNLRSGTHTLEIKAAASGAFQVDISHCNKTISFR